MSKDEQDTEQEQPAPGQLDTPEPSHACEGTDGCSGCQGWFGSETPACGMLRPVNLRRPSTARFVVAAAILVLAVIASPLADVVMFGIHDHIAAAQTKSMLVTVADAQSAHHCEVWMSPADVTPVDLPATPAVAMLAPSPAGVLIVAAPFPSFPPPRT